jgi:hypothetical protein
LIPFLFSVLLLPGCFHLPSSSRSANRAALTAPVAERFAYEKATLITGQEKEVAAKSAFSVKQVKLTGICCGLAPDGQQRSLVIDYYLPKGEEKHPVLLILPMLGGSYPLEKYFAVYFAKRGFAALIVHRDKLPRNSKIEAVDGMLRDSVLANRQAIDWIETRPELDAERIGVFGISMGSIKGALLTPLDDRVRAATLGLVGGDLPYIMSYTTENGIARRREEILRDEHLTLDELHERLRKSVTCDPNSVAQFVDPKKVLLVLGAFDTVVPAKKGLELREKMGKPETILVPSGHYTAVLFLPYIQHQCLKFFERKLSATQESQQVRVTSHGGAGVLNNNRK